MDIHDLNPRHFDQGVRYLRIKRVLQSRASVLSSLYVPTQHVTGETMRVIYKGQEWALADWRAQGRGEARLERSLALFYDPIRREGHYEVDIFPKGQYGRGRCPRWVVREAGGKGWERLTDPSPTVDCALAEALMTTRRPGLDRCCQCQTQCRDPSAADFYLLISKARLLTLYYVERK